MKQKHVKLKTDFGLSFSLGRILVIVAVATPLASCIIACIGVGIFAYPYISSFEENTVLRVFLQEIIQSCQLIIIFAAVAVGIAGVILGSFAARRFVRPLQQLYANITRLGNVDLEEDTGKDAHLFDTRIVEIKKMQQTIEALRSGIKSFQKYVPPDLVTGIMKGHKQAELEAEKRMMTIYFSDIAGFTSLSESLSPERLMEELGIYFQVLTHTILSNRGTIDKYIGDSIMAFWGAPDRLDDHGVLACRAALQCQNFVKGISRDWVKKGLPPLHTRVGLHTGEVLVGNVGYAKRMNYTVMGDNVNIASRLEGLNKYYGTEILISESTFVCAKNEIEARLIDFVVVKGRSQGIPIYELAAEKNTLDREWVDFYQEFNTAMELYRTKQWSRAYELLSTTSCPNPDDKPLQIMRERCAAFIKSPPPPHWCGEVIMRDK